MYLTLTGTTEYTATKVWIDKKFGDESSRPDVELQLWRFREGDAYTTAAPVRDNGEIITIELDGDEDEDGNGAITLDSKLNKALEELPKYDSEGYRYIYVLREYMTQTGGDDSYEQVFGEVQEDGTVEDTVEGSSEGRAEGDTFLYKNGTLSNRITGTVQAEATKVWEAAAFQSELGDVTVEFTLQYRIKDSEDEWEDYQEDGVKVTRTLDGFLAENMDNRTVSAAADKYDAWGNELEYRWVETAVYQNGGENLLEDGEFILEQGDREMKYTATASQVETASGSYANRVTNQVKNEIGYTIQKEWLDENGKPVNPWEEEITLFLYQIPSGSALSGDMVPIVTIVLDGEIDPKSTIDMETGIEYREDDAWHVSVTGLPEFDENGREYEYLLLEEGAQPTYEIKRDEKTNDYEATVYNQRGPGSRIMVRKLWIDDNDAQHREPVQVEVYDKTTNDRVAGPVTIGESGVWQKLIGIKTASPSNVYVREVSMGEAEDGETGDFPVATASNAEPGSGEDEEVRYECTTDNHIYEVSYEDTPTVIAGTYFYTVTNRRLGNIDLTVTKEWNDGDGERRKLLEAALEELGKNGNVNLYPAIKLQLVGDGDMSQFKEPGDWIQVGTERVLIEDQDGNPAASVQELKLDVQEEASSPQKLYFHNLPKYDLSGQVVHYQVEEVWVLEKNGEDPKVLTWSMLAEEYPTIYDLAAVYQVSYEEEYLVNSDTSYHDLDIQNITVTNTLQGTKTVRWHKQWADSYNNDANLRPDLYLNIYSYGRDSDGNMQTQLVRENYRWENSSGEDENESGALYDSSRHWHVLLEDMPKYDSLGYEIIYYAVEHTAVDAESFGYVEAGYAAPVLSIGEKPTVPGEDANPDGVSANPQEIGAVSGPQGSAEENTAENGWMLNVSAHEGDSTWALAEEGTFINRLNGTVSVAGRKNWSSLPAGFDLADLPDVEFVLDRYVIVDDPLTEEEKELRDEEKRMWKYEVATLHISSDDWAYLQQSGSYRFTIRYEGTNKIVRDANGTISFEPENSNTAKELPQFDEHGRLYYYVLREESMGTEEGTWSSNFTDGAIFTVENPDGTYIINNRYKEEQGGSLTIKKLLHLSGTIDPETSEFTPSVYPAMQFRLYRRYTTNAGGSSDWTYVTTVTWSASEVKAEYVKQNPNGGEGWVEWIHEFDDLAVYAPNGSEYEYMAAEVRTSLDGYDTWVAAGNIEKGSVEKYIRDDGNQPQEPAPLNPDSTSGTLLVTKRCGRPRIPMQKRQVLPRQPLSTEGIRRMTG